FAAPVSVELHADFRSGALNLKRVAFRPCSNCSQGTVRSVLPWSLATRGDAVVRDRLADETRSVSYAEGQVRFPVETLRSLSLCLAFP
ncbi:MAG: hypothetical protein ACI9EF_003262, partial [Pseudohongiellaceae bacterium]